MMYSKSGSSRGRPTHAYIVGLAVGAGSAAIVILIVAGLAGPPTRRLTLGDWALVAVTIANMAVVVEGARRVLVEVGKQGAMTRRVLVDGLRNAQKENNSAVNRTVDAVQRLVEDGRGYQRQVGRAVNRMSDRLTRLEHSVDEIKRAALMERGSSAAEHGGPETGLAPENEPRDRVANRHLDDIQRVKEAWARIQAEQTSFSPDRLSRYLAPHGLRVAPLRNWNVGSALVAVTRPGSGIGYLVPSTETAISAVVDYFDIPLAAARTDYIRALVEPAYLRIEGGDFVLQRRGKVE